MREFEAYGVTAASVPEPSTYTPLLLGGFIFLGALVRRRQLLR